MNKLNNSVNINRDDNTLNDYLYCYNLFGKAPSRINIIGHFKYVEFSKVMIDLEQVSIYNSTDVISNAELDIVNIKALVKIKENIFVSYQVYDSLSEDSLVGDVSIFYNYDDKTKDNNGFIEDLTNTILDLQIEADDSVHKMNTIVINQGVADIEPIDMLNIDYENIEHYFNDNTIKAANKLSKVLKNNKKGLSIIYGERGVGKTSLISWMSTNINKIFIYLPCTLIETTINAADFRSLLKKYKNSVIIIDDSELYYNNAYNKSNVFTNNLLQLVDGLQSDGLDTNFVLIMNTSDINDIDQTLLECNNFIDIIEVKALELEKVKELNKYLGNKTKAKELKLIDVLRPRDIKVKNEMGFN